MAKADFYILNKRDHSDRLSFLARLIEKATRLGHNIYIHTSHSQQATEIDDYLWTYKIESFLPHELNSADVSSVPITSAPITIGFSEDCGSHNDLLINLANELPPFYKKFDRIAEIVIQNESVLKTLRDHYRQIKKDGTEALIHDFRKPK
ncbi:DNA polymerase III subunit chi [Alkalimarinus alittae]|uniref:DNA polymerase III subunit chi n=1 Tax=Alkalimarinus alittae TaxID=2961619 RepID=A0ABY6MYX0_9ALTE|nr:DNA polymerase III subunit chi [Alkalimarinus alittae]UZE94982.1 DNA polymerase III subunit chi [Alkalimarinus alittae]